MIESIEGGIFLIIGIAMKGMMGWDEYSITYKKTMATFDGNNSF
jgi:hypothetical protein